MSQPEDLRAQFIAAELNALYERDPQKVLGLVHRLYVFKPEEANETLMEAVNLIGAGIIECPDELKKALGEQAPHLYNGIRKVADAAVEMNDKRPTHNSNLN